VELAFRESSVRFVIRWPVISSFLLMFGATPGKHQNRTHRNFPIAG